MSDCGLAILWHLHQPDYRDPATGIPVLPWARLHALRGYRDLAVETVEHEAPVAVNLVPSLLDQLLHYAGGGSDPHLDHTRIPADSLTDRQHRAIGATFLGGHPRLRRMWPDYALIEDRLVGGAALSTAEWRDLQVWSTLAWFGATAVRDHPEIAELRRKGRGFSEDDKALMLAAQEAILHDLPARLSAVARCGAADLTTSPYYHPILPLLVDTSHARRSMPDVPISPRFAWPEDALRQLVKGRERVEEILGVLPTGLWPSEGSVGPEVVEIVAQAGFRWLVSDDGVLARSQRTEAARPGPWDLGHGVVGFFRDHDLSDRIGFQYANRDASEAIEDLIGAARARGGLVTLALDGENPWEVWPDAGAAFRERLYDAMRAGPCRGVRLGEAAEGPVVGTVSRLHTGSWIGADLQIWFGDPLDRVAWGWLAEARRRVAAAPESKAEAALERLLPAEGSDWMWWFGPEFDTPFAATFDGLFRAHLRAVYQALDEPPPDALHHPIGEDTRGIREPVGWVAPELDGPPTWSAWSAAGEIPIGRGGSMASGVAWLKRALFGWDLVGNLWIRVDGDGPEPDANWEVEVDGEQVAVPLGGGRAEVGALAGAAFRGPTGSVGAPVHGTVVVRAPSARLVGVRVRGADGAVRASLPRHALPDPPDPRSWWWV